MPSMAQCRRDPRCDFVAVHPETEESPAWFCKRDDWLTGEYQFGWYTAVKPRAFGVQDYRFMLNRRTECDGAPLDTAVGVVKPRHRPYVGRRSPMSPNYAVVMLDARTSAWTFDQTKTFLIFPCPTSDYAAATSRVSNRS